MKATVNRIGEIRRPNAYRHFLLMEELEFLELEMYGLVSSAVECDEDIRNGNEEKGRDEIGHEYGGED